MFLNNGFLSVRIIDDWIIDTQLILPGKTTEAISSPRGRLGVSGGAQLRTLPPGYWKNTPWTSLSTIWYPEGFQGGDFSLSDSRLVFFCSPRVSGGRHYFLFLFFGTGKQKRLHVECGDFCLYVYMLQWTCGTSYSPESLTRLENPENP